MHLCLTVEGITSGLHLSVSPGHPPPPPEVWFGLRCERRAARQITLWLQNIVMN